MAWDNAKSILEPPMNNSIANRRCEAGDNQI